MSEEQNRISQMPCRDEKDRRSIARIGNKVDRLGGTSKVWTGVSRTSALGLAGSDGHHQASRATAAQGQRNDGRVPGTTSPLLPSTHRPLVTHRARVAAP
jgi:hypothetical protein